MKDFFFLQNIGGDFVDTLGWDKASLSFKEAMRVTHKTRAKLILFPVFSFQFSCIQTETQTVQIHFLPISDAEEKHWKFRSLLFYEKMLAKEYIFLS